MINLTHSDRKFIRLEKSRIRAKFLDPKKQEEMITELYKRFSGEPKVTEVKTEKAVPKPAEKKEIKAEKAPKVKKEKPKAK